MRLRLHLVLTCAILLSALARPADAQIVPGWNTKQFALERIDADRIRLMRDVEIEGETGSANAGQKFFADDLEMNTKTGELTASGNVVFQTPTSRIAAETAVFNTKTKLGTFTNATGIAQLGARGLQNQSMFGTLEPDVYFYGTTIEKIAADKYRINKGGFTTCVQPTPRWQIVSGRATVNLNDYVVMRNAIVRVKDVPVFYLPILYYPIQEDDRATGILLPTYSTSTYTGSSISNGLFWAVSRSQDLTFFHDWFFTSSSGLGAEYRYLLGPKAQGTVRAYSLNEKEAIIAGFARPARQSKIIIGTLSQSLPLGLSARANVDYSTDVATQKLYSNSFFEATTSRRTINGGLTGVWGGLSASTGYSRTEYFYSATTSQVSGSAPGASIVYSRKLPLLPVYFSGSADASRVLFIDRTATATVDKSVDQVDLNQSLRVPLSSLPFLSVNGSFAYRFTRVDESLAADKRTQVEVPINRRYADMGVDVVGPVLTRVFSPNNRVASRLKHVIEPSYSVKRRTTIETQDFIPTAVAPETIVGGTTQLSYGLANRVLIRQDDPLKPTAAASRELLNVSVRQSYYSDLRASKYDAGYAFSYLYRTASPFSPVAVAVRAVPTGSMVVDFKLEYDPRKEARFKVVGVGLNGSFSSSLIETTAGWSRLSYGTETIGGTGGTVNAIIVRSNNYFAQTTKFILGGGKYGANVTLNYDITRSTLVNQTYGAYYNAQCCGISAEYVSYNYGSGSSTVFAGSTLLPQNRRFNLSFTLAGVGSFSNFFGAFGGGS